MKYVTYHSSPANDPTTLDRLKQHARDGDIVAEYYDDLSTSEDRPEQKKAIAKCKETGATLLIMDLSQIENLDESEKEGIRVKRLS